MTEQTDPNIEKGVEAEADGDQQVSVEVMKSRIAELEAEAAKHRNIRKSVERERDELKAKTKSTTDQDYKSLWQQEAEAKSKLLTRVKSAAVNEAVTQRLTKAGVVPDAIEAAAKLVDANLIEWDEDNGVDGASVTAAVAKLKSQYGILFESKVAKTEPKNPADGSSTNANEMKRSDFDKLDPLERMARIKKGTRIVD